MLVLFCVALMMALIGQPVGAQSPSPIGVWLDASGRVQVEIEPCGELLCGKLVWFQWPDDEKGLPVVDLKNKDPKLRGRPLLGLRSLVGLRQTGERSWAGGRIYNPDDGTDYRATMTMDDNGNMRVRVYVLLPLFGQTQIWRRVR